MSRVERVLTGIAVLSLLVLAGCTGKDTPKQGSASSGALTRPEQTAAVPVVVAKVERGTIPIQLSAIGTGRAFQSVSVESQVAGVVKEVHYRQGQFVRKGDLLVTLDKSPFIATLEQAHAALARDNAQAELSVADLKRSKQLYHQGIVSREQYDQSLANLDGGPGHRARRPGCHPDSENPAFLLLSLCTHQRRHGSSIGFRWHCGQGQ